MQGDRVARVYILDAPYRIDKLYEYAIPSDLRGKIRAGIFAAVNFGAGKKPCRALVRETSNESEYPQEKLKPILYISDPGLELTPEQLGLCLFLREQTFCTFGEAVRAVIPQAAFTGTNIKYTVSYAVTAKGEAALADDTLSRSKAKKALLERIKGEPYILRTVLLEESASNSAKLKALLDYGYIEEAKTENYRDPLTDKILPPKTENILNDCQQKAFDTLKTLCSTGKPEAALLHGITGSGKTRVIKALTDTVLESGRQVIILVPEIALTPQTLDLFASFYGQDIAVLHSSLSAGERYDAWRRIKEGKVSVCIGTRSAVFAPFERLGLIVIDEEQEHTYKSDSDPKYHAMDIARYRCAHQNAMMLLSSATPSLQSYYKAMSGKYHLVELGERYGDAKLPEAVICDMRGELSKGDTKAIGNELYREIKQTLADGKQAIIFINRRGYNNYLTCTKCGAVMMCPHCSVSLTNHTVGNRNELRCHYCGYRTYSPKVCPECKSEHLRFVGFGTQHVEEELKELFPDKRVMRMDADTTSTKFAYETILGAFRRHEADILIGTQMVTKGHDFPDVTLSGILLADMTLYLDDYRANERTFSLITQVIGRAGRASFSGKAVIQTYNPDHPVLALAAEQDYKTFYNNEIALRRALVFPPVCDIFLITLCSKNENALLTTAAKMNTELRTMLNETDTVDLILFGPFEAPIYKVSEFYRMRFVAKGRSNAPTRALLRDLLDNFSKAGGSTPVTVSVDVNPTNL